MYTRQIQKLIAEEKQSITDKELFGSKAYQAYIQNIADNISGKYGRGAKVKLVYDPDNDVVGHTNGKKIFINMANKYTSFLKKRELKNLSGVGLLGHECGHILFTDFPAINSYEKFLESGKLYPRKLHGKQFSKISHQQSLEELNQIIAKVNPNVIHVLSKIAFRFSNIIEDGYVEYKMRLRFPGTVSIGISINNISQAKQTPSLAEMIDKNYEPFAIVHNLLLQYAKQGYTNNPEGLCNEYTDLISDCIPTIDKAVHDDDPKERFVAVNCLLVYCWKYIKPFLDMANDPNTDQDQSNDSSEHSNGDDNDQGSSEHSNGDDNDQGSSEHSNGDDNDQGSSEHSNGDHNDQGSSDNSDRSKSTENGSNQGSGSSNNGESSDNSQGSQKSESSKSDDIEKIMTKLREMLEQSSSIPQNVETHSVDHGFSDDNDNDDKNQEQERLIHEKTVVEDLVSQGDGKMEMNNSYIPRIISSACQDVVTAAATEKVAAAVEDDIEIELDKGSSDILKGIHKNISITINRQREMQGDEAVEYNNVMKELKPISIMLQKSLMREIKTRQRNSTDRGLMMGNRIDHTSYYRNDGKIFTKRNRPDEQMDLSVGVLVDQSGSMSGERIRMARLMAMVVYDFCRSMNIPITIYGHSCIKHHVSLYSYAEFDSIDGNDKYRLLHMYPEATNRDGCAVRYVANKLVDRTEKTKLFSVCFFLPKRFEIPINSRVSG